MAYELQNLAWKVTGLRSSTKFVLIALCDYSNKEKNFECYPSHSTLAERTGSSVSTVQRAIKELHKLELITLRHRYKTRERYSSNLYKINIRKLRELSKTKKTKVNLTSPNSHHDQRDVVTVTDKPLTTAFKLTNTIKCMDKSTALAEPRRPISPHRMREICDEVGYSKTKLFRYTKSN